MSQQWEDVRLTGMVRSHVLCRTTRRHRYPDEYADHPDTRDARGVLVTVRREQRCERCGTVRSYIINVLVWEVVRSARYAYEDDYKGAGAGGRFDPAALLRANFMATSPLVDQLDGAPKRAPKKRVKAPT